MNLVNFAKVLTKVCATFFVLLHCCCGDAVSAAKPGCIFFVHDLHEHKEMYPLILKTVEPFTTTHDVSFVSGGDFSTHFIPATRSDMFGKSHVEFAKCDMKATCGQEYIIQLIQLLQKAGVHVFNCPGNHDFCHEPRGSEMYKASDGAMKPKPGVNDFVLRTFATKSGCSFFNSNLPFGGKYGSDINPLARKSATIGGYSCVSWCTSNVFDGSAPEHPSLWFSGSSASERTTSSIAKFKESMGTAASSAGSRRIVVFAHEERSKFEKVLPTLGYPLNKIIVFTAHRHDEHEYYDKIGRSRCFADRSGTIWIVTKPFGMELAMLRDNLVNIAETESGKTVCELKF